MMNERYQLKYEKILEIIPDIADCINGDLILVGGTALAIFHTKHRISVDLDFILIKGSDSELKEKLKGCMTNKGYQTQRAAYGNQFVIQFENTGIKVEIFSPDFKIKKIEQKKIGDSKLLVASIDDILEMKRISYQNRLAARDLFDIFFILKDKGTGFDVVIGLIRKFGPPENVDDLEGMVNKKEDFDLFKKVIENASKTGS
jgi:predicted nucleotidyltransferase component of viral defense system